MKSFLRFAIWNWPWRRKPPPPPRPLVFLVLLSSTSFLLYVFLLSRSSSSSNYSSSPSSILMKPLHSFRRRSTPPPVSYTCPGGFGVRKTVDHTRPGPKIDAKVLLFVETTFSRGGREVAELLVHNRMKYKVEVAGKGLPLLTNGDKGRFGCIIFENYTRYLSMDKWNRELLDKYLREYGVGLIGLLPAREETLVHASLHKSTTANGGGFDKDSNNDLLVSSNVKLKDAYLSSSSPVLRIARAGGDIVRGQIPNDPHDLFTVFYGAMGDDSKDKNGSKGNLNKAYYRPVLQATRMSDDPEGETDYFATGGGGGISSSGSSSAPQTVVIEDIGAADGIKKVLFGGGLKFWLHRVLLLDSLSYLSRGRLSLPLKRHILIDIDDIFVGEKGTRLRPEDVDAMISAQQRLRQVVPNFRFNLGFSGKWWHSGDEEENAGDDALLAKASEFTWFGHMWAHLQPHLSSNATALTLDMLKNKQFAVDKGIPVDGSYSVSPHHSGVYPVHEPLYDAWRRSWGVKVTSTEEYPHLRPARLRRGFIHKGLMVLPRQTCGLFTHTIFIDRYPGGRQKLDESIFGGELFQSVVYNSVGVFMTHMSNYGNDRLGLYTWESAVAFLRCWTNLALASLPPLRLAERYFTLHPDEMDPLWTNPCDDIRHKKIWGGNKTCPVTDGQQQVTAGTPGSSGSIARVPSLLVVGPQKTGTTALYAFLSLHPRVASNLPSPDTFEEVQFFNGKNYYKGIDWYFKFFEGPSSSTLPLDPSGITLNETTANNPSHNVSNVSFLPKVQQPLLFEKSATYFDNEVVPRRAHSLLPRAKLIAILISPVKRAYSWWWHMRAHNDSVALNFTFYDVLTASPGTAPKSLRDLRARCLNPGRYAQHLERWLSYYTPQQLLILDGDQLKSDPVKVMARVQHFLQLEPTIDYSTKIRYDKVKGFYCTVVNEKKNKCLGKGKGRKYPPMDARSEKYLQTYYKSQNNALLKLLKRLDQPIPEWLKDDLSHRSFS